MEEQIKIIYQQILKKFNKGGRGFIHFDNYFNEIKGPEIDRTIRGLREIADGKEQDGRYLDEQSKIDALNFIQELENLTKDKW